MADLTPPSLEHEFRFEAPLLGRAKASISVSGFGEATIRHPSLRTPVTFSVDRAVLTVLPPPGTDLPVPARALRAYHLLVDQMTPPTVWLVFRAPTDIGQVKWAHRRAMGASEIMALDVLALPIAEPELLALAWRDGGGQVERDPAAALSLIVPLASPDVALTARALDRRATRRQAAFQAAGAIVFAGVGAERIVAGSWPVWTALRAGAAAMSAAWIVALLALALPLRPERRTPRRVLRWVLLGSLALVALGLALGARNTTGGGWLIVVSALAAAGFCGVNGGLSLRKIRRYSSLEARAADPVAGPQARRLAPVLALSAVFALLVLSVCVVLEERAAIDVRLAKRVTLVPEEIGERWVRDGSMRINDGDLDQHICGGDDDQLPAHTTSIHAPLKLQMPDRGFLDGAANLTVLIAPTTSAAEAEFAATSLPGYLECTGAAMAREMATWTEGRTGAVEPVLLASRVIELVDEGRVDTFQAIVPMPNDKHKTITGAFVRLREGRIIVRLPIVLFGIVPQMGAIDDVINAQVARLTAAEEAST